MIRAQQLEREGGALGEDVIEMGSFASEKCDLCGKSIPKMYPEVGLCMRCEIAVRRKLVLDKIDFGRDVGEPLRNDLAEFLAYDAVRRQKLQFLRCSLLAFRSPFRQFTYAWNGLAGNISITEDVFDRVLGFLETVSSRATQKQLPKKIG